MYNKKIWSSSTQLFKIWGCKFLSAFIDYELFLQFKITIFYKI